MTTVPFDVQLDIPPKYVLYSIYDNSGGIGLILTSTDQGIFVKGFSKGPSVARDTGKVKVGDRLCFINHFPIRDIQDAKHYLGMVRTAFYCLCLVQLTLIKL